MKLDKDLLIKAFENIELDFSEITVKVTDKNIEFFENIGLSNELIDFFKEISFLYEIDFDGIYLNAVNKFRTENLKEINKELYK